MAWELRNDRQIWLQLSDILMQRIVSGVYPAGSWLPSVRELAAEAGVNPNTMQRALASLEESGLACVYRNTGRHVTSDKELLTLARTKMAEEQFAIFADKMKQLGYPDDELAQFLKTKGETL